MNIKSVTEANAALVAGFRKIFATRDFIFHDGEKVRRLSIAGRTQALAAGVAAITLGFSGYGVTAAAFDTAAASGMTGASASTQKIEVMQAEVAAMQADVVALKKAASQHAARVEHRQAFLAAVLSGKGDPEALAEMALAPTDKAEGRAAAWVMAPLERVEARQAKLAAQAAESAEARYAAAAKHLRRLGVRAKPVAAMGGPFEPVDAATGASAGESNADAQFRSLFMSWKKLDSLEQAAIAIPSLQPVDNLTLTSNFGVRSDPFRGTAAMHAGIDIPGAIGTPIYATADGMVLRAQRAGGYGNLIEINHGKGIATRYGHLSKIMVSANSRVRRGQLIGLMGSTGRSTGSHLHYEVRIAGAPVNPIPYMQTADYLVAAQDKALRTTQASAMGGPAN